MREALRQALRQWKMYAECEPDRDMKTEVSTEAELYRAHWALAERKKVEMTDWQPADTAPKDGRVILAALRYRDDCGDAGILTVQWHAPWGQWVMAGCLVGIQNNVKDEENADLTHWMPLPPKPTN